MESGATKTKVSEIVVYLFTLVLVAPHSILKKDDEGKNFLIIKIINKDMLDHCYNYAGTSIELFSILVPA